MKKIFLFILSLVLLSSCSENIELNNVAAFQGYKDNQLWDSDDASATKTASFITIVGITYTDNVSLKVPLPDGNIVQTDPSTYKTYNLGTSVSCEAIYNNIINGGTYTYEAKFDVGDGQIVITNYNGTSVSGTFRFNAINTDDESTQPATVNFNKGNFYNVPVTPAP